MTLRSLPDDVRTDRGIPARHRSRTITRASSGRSPAWVDRLRGSDPGLLRLRNALQAVATIGVAMAAEWLFVHLTHALLIDTHGAVLPAQQQALVDAQHHGLTVIAIMLGAIVGLLASFGGALFPTPRSTLINFALLPVPMIAGLALGLTLGDHRVLALGSLALVLALGAYCRRFGPSGFMGGMLLFMGDFFGFFLHLEVGIGDIGWLSAEIAIGALVAIIAQFTLFYPSRRAALRRMVRSYSVRSREVSARALELFDRPAAERVRVSRSLHRRLVRLNETALLIDAQLGNDSAVPDGWTAAELHQRLFDSELTLSTLARLAERIAELDLTPELRAQVRGSLEAVSELDPLRAEFAGRELLGLLRETPTAIDGAGLDRSGHIVLHRFATSVIGFVEAVQAWRSAVSTVGDETASTPPFQPSVTAFAGWLPGSAMVSAAASLESGHHLRDKVRLQPYTRVAIQMLVAVTAAIVLGDMLSGRRFYWAVIAAFVTFMGANNAGEQLRKGALRVVGTVVGVFLGAIGAHLVGQHTNAAIAVILVSLFLGLYLMRISYAFMVIGITIMVSQLYVQLNEFSDSLLRLRLEETALGAGVAVVTVLCVVPLRHGRVIRLAARQYFQALTSTVELAAGRLSDSSSEVELRASIRALDASYQTLLVTAVPTGAPFAGRLAGRNNDTAHLLRGVAASRHYARNLVVDTEASCPVPAEARSELDTARQRLSESLGALLAGIQDGFGGRSYVRAAGSFDTVRAHFPSDAPTAPRQLALRDLQLVDGSLAALAAALGMSVTALDTTGTIAGSAVSEVTPRRR